MAVEQGQHEAFEVHRYKGQLGIDTPKLEYVATFWSAAEAVEMDKLVNGDYAQDVYTQTFKQIGVVVVNGDAYYDTKQPPVPVEFVK